MWGEMHTWHVSKMDGDYRVYIIRAVPYWISCVRLCYRAVKIKDVCVSGILNGPVALLSLWRLRPGPRKRHPSSHNTRPPPSSSDRILINWHILPLTPRPISLLSWIIKFNRNLKSKLCPDDLHTQCDLNIEHQI